MLHIHALSVFTTITKCSLLNPKEADMDLEPLHGLHGLQDIFLEYGQYSNVPLSSHLTWLHLMDCTALCVQVACCTPGLKDLTVSNATLSASHGDGLLSCSELTSLDVLNCSISGSHADAHFTVGEDYMLCIPPNITSLTQLRRLCVAVETYNDDALDVSWTYGLTSLHSLDLHIEGEVTLSQGLTQLQQLTMLTVAAMPWYC